MSHHVDLAEPRRRVVPISGLVLNELAESRARLLSSLFPASSVTRFVTRSNRATKGILATRTCTLVAAGTKRGARDRSYPHAGFPSWLGDRNIES